MESIEEPQTIFDLTSSELDVLMLYRKLSPEQQNIIADYISEQTKDKLLER